ncbi:unnamed protein product, partial [Candidula unifasciata]
MHQRRTLEDRYQILVRALVAIATLSVRPSLGALFCPSVVAISNYTITAENYNISDGDANTTLVTFSIASHPFLACTLTTPRCTSFLIDPLILPVQTFLFTVVDIGFNAFQVRVIINFPVNFTANFEVRWGRNGQPSSSDDLNEGCLVRTGGLVDECTTNPCLHASQCQDLVSGYLCVCLQGYNGMTCRT